MIATAFCQNNAFAQEAVDLGLPSGTLWATYNVGADTPESLGNYYAWGETSTKYSYGWSNYEFGSRVDGMVTKYCGIAKFGYDRFTDNRSKLMQYDDVATREWGNEWCMPTKEQFEELVNNCRWTTTQRNNVKGKEVRGPNGKTIFFPSAGNIQFSKRYPGGYMGMYWSSTIANEPSEAYKLEFSTYGDLQDCHVSIIGRFCGCTIRPVKKTQADIAREKEEEDIKNAPSSTDEPSFSDLVGKKVIIDFIASIYGDGKKKNEASKQGDYFTIDEKMENVSLTVLSCKDKYELRVKKNARSLDILNGKGADWKVFRWNLATISKSSGNKIVIDLKGRYCMRLYCRIFGPNDKVRKNINISEYQFADQ